MAIQFQVKTILHLYPQATIIHCLNSKKIGFVKIHLHELVPTAFLAIIGY